MTDLEIAQKNEMIPISEVAEKIGIHEDQLDFYGKYKAKITMKTLREFLEKAENPKTRGKLILTTAVTPTPAGEGKSTDSTKSGKRLSSRSGSRPSVRASA